MKATESQTPNTKKDNISPPVAPSSVKHGRGRRGTGEERQLLFQPISEAEVTEEQPLINPPTNPYTIAGFCYRCECLSPSDDRWGFKCSQPFVTLTMARNKGECNYFIESGRVLKAKRNYQPKEKKGWKSMECYTSELLKCVRCFSFVKKDTIHRRGFCPYCECDEFEIVLPPYEVLP